ncbi:helix-turn-helix domain-containing protein [Treponema sp. UBA7567]|uniref:helix-turn-helix domain-containing protein n=1 Tax=Treponema sp. UBA7567 TaxID=1947748 RepID=UPI0025DDA5D8|nr:helix-turn-helix domain-containing protein [Treponema sp. UBA7567]
MNELLTTKEVAKLLKVSEQTIRTMTNSHEIPHYRMGKMIRYSRQEIMALFGGELEADPVLDWLIKITQRRKEGKI